MWKTVEPIITEAVVVLIPVLVAFLASWLRRWTQVEIVRAAVKQVEEESWEECPYEKKARAVELVSERTGALTRMHPYEVGVLVEKVLPEVQEQVKQQQPKRKERRSIGATFGEK